MIIDDIKKKLPTVMKGANVEDHLEAFVYGLQDTKDILDYLIDHSSIETAEGVWLDLWGKLLGVPRQLRSWFPNEIFRFKAENEVDPGDTNNAFLSSSGLNGGRFEVSTGGPRTPTQTMTDIEYRKLIFAKMASLQSGSSRYDLWNYILNAYGIKSKITNEGSRTNLYSLVDANYILGGEFDNPSDLLNFDFVSSGSTFTHTANFGGSAIIDSSTPGTNGYITQQFDVLGGEYLFFINFPEVISLVPTTKLFIDVSLINESGGSVPYSFAIDTPIPSECSVLGSVYCSDGIVAAKVIVSAFSQQKVTISRMVFLPYISKAEINYLKENAPVNAGSQALFSYNPDFSEGY